MFTEVVKAEYAGDYRVKLWFHDEVTMDDLIEF